MEPDPTAVSPTDPTDAADPTALSPTATPMTAADGGPLWDLLVIGGGTAGIVGAKTAAGFGARVLLVERARTGGDCLWTGCVPSKALLAAAGAASTARTSGRYGVHASSVDVDFAAVMAHVHGAVEQIAPVDSPQTLEKAGVRVRSGIAVLTGPDTAEVDGIPVRFRQALLATGSEPSLPDVPGLADADPLTSDTVWHLSELPARLTVLGGGSIGCELGQAFARLGSAVTIVETAGRLLANEDPVASSLVHDALVADGVEVLTSVTVDGVSTSFPGAQGGSLILEDGRTIDHDRLLVAAGRRPRTFDLGLDRAGVRTRRNGTVDVDGHLHTSNPRIWAAGDLTGYPPFTHVAGVHGSLVASNAILGLRRSVDPVVPRVTFTHPEIAAVGATTEPSEAAKAGHRVLVLDHAEVDRAVAEGQTAGTSRLTVDRRGRIVGATIVGPRAGESLAEVVLAVRQGLKPRDIAGTTHAYPTYADGVWNAAIGDVRATLASPIAARATSLLAAVRSRWLDRTSRS